MKPATQTAVAVGAGVLATAAYFGTQERGVTRDQNCTYQSPWTTDVAAWGAGAALIWLGYRHRSFLISFLGATIAALHVAQYARHKTARALEARA